MLYKP